MAAGALTATRLDGPAGRVYRGRSPGATDPAPGATDLPTSPMRIAAMTSTPVDPRVVRVRPEGDR